MPNGKTITLFLMDGTPSGRIKCTIKNWTGVVYKVPQVKLDDCRQIDTLKQSGVYFLFGMDKKGRPAVYVGQGGSRSNGQGVLFRAQEPHDSISDWTESVMMITTDNSFGPTEISYLENRFCTMAKESEQYVVLNSNTPNPGNVTEEKQSELEEFIEYAEMVIGALGYKVFEANADNIPVPNGHFTNEIEDESLFQMHRSGISAQGKYTKDGGFIVLKGSKICPDCALSCPPAALTAREKYAGKLNSHHRLTADIPFTSPSTAAAFVCGYSINGRESWRNKNGQTLKEIQEGA